MCESTFRNWAIDSYTAVRLRRRAPARPRRDARSLLGPCGRAMAFVKIIVTQLTPLIEPTRKSRLHHHASIGHRAKHRGYSG
jgi:hypothetical protein